MAGLWELIIPASDKDTNPLTNPSFETGTTDWTTGGANTLAQSSEQSWRGLYSAKITYSNNTTLLEYNPLPLLATTTYYGIARLYVPSDWNPANGTYLRLDFANFIGATVTYSKRFIVGTDAVGKWILLRTLITTAADDAGVLRLNTDAAPSAGRSIYVDALKVGVLNSLYFDGDTPGCYWLGTPHASPSICPDNLRAQGVPTNFDDLGIYFGNPPNTEGAPLTLHSRAHPLVPGAQHYRTKVQPSEFTLPGWIMGTDYPTLHGLRTTLLNYLGPDLLYPEQPFVMRYLGNDADNPTFYEARLTDFQFQREGLSGVDKGIIKMLAERNPYWYEEGDQVAVLDRQDTLAVDYVLGFEDNAFTAMQGGGGGLTGRVRTMVIGNNGLLYMGGDFDNADGQAAADRVVVYNPANGTYTTLAATGANGNVYAMLKLPTGDIIIAGNFTTIGGAAHSRIVKYTPGSPGTYTAMGTGANGIVRALALGADGKVYAGGDFTDMGGVANTNYVAYWDGSWHAMDSGANNSVYAIVSHPTKTHLLYMGGAFTQVGSGPTTANRVARWNVDAGTWAAVGSSGMDGTVQALAFRGQESVLYAGGQFTTADGFTVNKVAGIFTDYNQWGRMGQGVTGGTVQMLAWSNLYQQLIVGGTFASAGDGTPIAPGLAYWRGGQWVHPGIEATAADGQCYVETPYGNYYLGIGDTGNWLLSGAPVELTNAGNVMAWPVITLKVTGAGTAGRLISLVNFSTGLNMYFDQVILEGQTLIIDTTPGDKRIYMRDNFGVETDLAGSALLQSSDFVAWGLKPGKNLVQLRVDDETGTPTVTAWLTYRRQYKSYDGAA